MNKTIESIIKLLSTKNKVQKIQLLYKLNDRINDLESQLKSKDELLMEAYESIVDRHSEYEGDYETCLHCGEGAFGLVKHDDNCIVKKAQDYISKES